MENNSSIRSNNSSNMCRYGDQIFSSSCRQYGRLSTRSIPAQFDDENRSVFHFEFMMRFDWLTFRIKKDRFDPHANPIRKQNHWDKQLPSKNLEPMYVVCCHCVLRRSDHENNKSMKNRWALCSFGTPILVVHFCSPCFFYDTVWSDRQ